MNEDVCVYCGDDINHDEPFIMVDESYLCDGHCLGDFLQTHGLVALKAV